MCNAYLWRAPGVVDGAGDEEAALAIDDHRPAVVPDLSAAGDGRGRREEEERKWLPRHALHGEKLLAREKKGCTHAPPAVCIYWGKKDILAWISRISKEPQTALEPWISRISTRVYTEVHIHMDSCFKSDGLFVLSNL